MPLFSVSLSINYRDQEHALTAQKTIVLEAATGQDARRQVLDNVDTYRRELGIEHCPIIAVNARLAGDQL